MTREQESAIKRCSYVFRKHSDFISSCNELKERKKILYQRDLHGKKGAALDMAELQEINRILKLFNQLK